MNTDIIARVDDSLQEENSPDLWAKLKPRLDMALSTSAHNLNGSSAILEDNTLTIFVMTDANRQWLDGKLRARVEGVVRGELGEVELAIKVGDPQPCLPPKPTLKDFNGDTPFEGFEYPKENWFKCPVALIEAFPDFDTKAELQVVFYILRHTWGYQDFDDYKKITLDEFQYGRKKRDGSRIDNGIGMNKQAIIDGVKRAVKHGFIVIEEDKRDAARNKKYYRLNMQ